MKKLLIFFAILESIAATCPLHLLYQNYDTERLFRQLRRRLRDTDLAFLNACLAVVEGNYGPVEMYLSQGGDPMRKLTSTDVKLLNRPSAFDEGHTLVHLAIR